MSTAQSLYAGMFSVGKTHNNTATTSLRSEYNLDDSAKIAFWSFQPFSSGTIDTVIFYVNTITGISPFYTASLQGLNVSGGPNNTDVGGTSTSIKIENSGWQQLTLTTPYDNAGGEFLALVIEHDSGTIDTSNYSTIKLQELNFETQAYPIWGTGVSIGQLHKGSGIKIPVFGIRDNLKTQGTPILHTFDSINTSGHIIAQKFTLPEGIGNSFNLTRLRVSDFSIPSGSDFKIGIWNTSGTRLYNADLSSGKMQDPTVRYNSVDFVFQESSPTSLSFGTTYYAGFEAVNSNIITLGTFEVPVANDMSAFPLGTDVCLSKFDGSSWTDTANERPFLDVVFLDTVQPPTGVNTSNDSIIFESEIIKGNIF